MTDLHGNEALVFDYGSAESLVTSARAASTAIEGQHGSRASAVEHARTDFSGGFAVTFGENASIARNDATQLAVALDGLATITSNLIDAAHAEDARRKTAREWYIERENRGTGDKVHDFVFGEDDPPSGPQAPPAVEPAPVPPNRSRPTTSGAGAGTTSSARGRPPGRDRRAEHRRPVRLLRGPGEEPAGLLRRRPGHRGARSERHEGGVLRDPGVHPPGRRAGGSGLDRHHPAASSASGVVSAGRGSRTPSTAPGASPVAVVAVTRREVASRGVKTVECRREVLTSTAALPDRDSRADVVVVAYHAALSAAERIAITGPARRTAALGRVLVALGVTLSLAVMTLIAGVAGWIPAWPVVAALALVGVALVTLAVVGLLDLRRVWTTWSTAVLDAHRRVIPEDLNQARREVTEHVPGSWGSAEGLRARRCWADLVSVATVPRPVAQSRPGPSANRGQREDGTIWTTPTELPGGRLDDGEYAALAGRFITLAEDLRAGRVTERSPEHVEGWQEVAVLARRTGEAGRGRVDWAPVLRP